MQRFLCVGIFLMLFIFFNYSVYGQNYYNKRFVVSELSLGVLIKELDSVLNIASIGNNGDTFLTCFITLDNQGGLADSLCLGSDETSAFGFLPDGDGHSSINNKLLSFGSHIFPGNLGGGWYLVVNQIGEVERERRYVSPMFDEKLGNSSAISVRYDGYLNNDNHVFLAYAGAPNQEETQADAGVICFDENDEMLWEKQWVTEDNEWPNALTFYNNSLFVAIEQNPDIYLVDTEVSIYKLNPETGIIENEWHEPWGFNFTQASEMISVEDGIVMVGSALQEPGQWTDACVLKINDEGEELWHTIIENPDTTYRRFFTEVVQTTDGNYVAAGEWKYRLPEFDEENGNFNDDGWLVKFDALTGAILWDRKYHYIEDTNDEHEIYDLTACSDGGVAFVGEALDLTINGDPDYEYPLQQGWVVKVDEHGCVVPNCQNSVDELEKERTHFIAGPNPVPAGQELHIYLHEHSTGGQFILTDTQGKEVKHFTAASSSTTYSFSTLGLSSGTYVLTLMKENELLQREKIIVE